MAGVRRAKAIPTIYDVASRAGVSIASVSRVLNGQGSPKAETRKRVLRAVRALSFVPDGAARALSSNLKEVVAVVFRRGGEVAFEDEEENLLFMDVINRGIEVAAQRRGFDVLISSVGVQEENVVARIAAIAGKADGVILHDQMLSKIEIARLADVVPIVTLAGNPSSASIKVRWLGICIRLSRRSASRSKSWDSPRSRFFTRGWAQPAVSTKSCSPSS